MAAEFALIPAVKFLYDLIKDSINNEEKRGKNFNEKFIIPIFNKLIGVHTSYNKMFWEAEVSLPVQNDHGQWYIPDAPLYNPPAADSDAKKLVLIVKDKFLKARKENEWIRDSLRNESKIILEKLPNNDAKRLIYSIMLYFWEDDISQYDDKFIDQRIALTEKEGGGRSEDSISEAITLKIMNETDPKELKEIFQNSRVNLNQRFTFCSIRYYNLQIKINHY